MKDFLMNKKLFKIKNTPIYIWGIDVKNAVINYNKTAYYKITIKDAE